MVPNTRQKNIPTICFLTKYEVLGIPPPNSNTKMQNKLQWNAYNKDTLPVPVYVLCIKQINHWFV